MFNGIKIVDKITQKQEAENRQTLTNAHDSYEKGLNTFAFFRTNDHSLSDDLVQEAFLKTWKYLVKNGKIDSMKSFLYHIMRHLIIDEYRKNKATSLDILIEKGFDLAVLENERIFDMMDGERAVLLIKKLPISYQRVMYMRYMQDLSLKEISLITGFSRNSIAVKTHRGLDRLKVLYDSK